MKKIFGIFSLLLAALFMSACQGEESKEEVVYNLVQAEILPDLLEIEVNLDEYSDADPITLEWTDAEWDGYGVVTYDVAFVREGGDFTRPVAVFHATSLVDSLRTKRTFTKAELKEVYANASLTTKDSEVTVEWIVRTAGGGKKLQSESVGTLVMTMTPDPDPFVVGSPIFVVGAGAFEAGQKMTYMPSIDFHTDKAIAAHYNDNAPYCKSFDYEIFTQLTAGQPVYFCTSQTPGDQDWYFTFNTETAETATTFVTSIKKDAVLSATVTADGVYRIRLNTATKEIYAKRISRVSHRVWANGATLDHDMTYLGNGVWQTDRTVPSNKNNGYKFLFFGLDGDQPHGAQYMDLNLNNGSMEGVVPEYWYVVSVQGGAANANGRANGTWKIPTEALDVPCRYTISMNDEAGAYTTSIEVL